MPCNTLQSAKEIHWKKRREMCLCNYSIFFLKNLGLYVINGFCLCGKRKKRDHKLLASKAKLSILRFGYCMFV